MKVFSNDDKGEFISIKLRIFCEEKSITFKYKALYMHKENGLVKKR